MIKVIIADDELHFLEFMKKVVEWESLGFQILGTARNGLDTLEMAKKLKPDIIFLDINMPKLNGLLMTEELKKTHKEVVIVLVTGYSEFEYARKAIQLGVEDYLLKPFSREELIIILKKLQLKLLKHFEESRKSDGERLMVREWMWIRLFSGVENHDMHTLDKFKRVGIDFCSDYFRVAVIEMDRFYERWDNSEELSLMRFSISNIWQESVTLKGKGYLVNESDKRLITILNFYNKEEAEAFSYEGYEKLQKVVKEYFELNISIGIGSLELSLEKINYSYKNALAALKSQFVTGGSQLIAFDDLREDSVKAGFYRVDLNDRLLLGLRKRSDKEVRGVLEDIKQDIVNNHLSVDLTNTMLFGLLSVCFSYITERGGDIVEIYGKDFKPYEYISSSPSLNACFEYLDDVFQKAVSLKKMKNKRSEEILKEILKMIQQMYSSPDLTVEGIANMLYLDSSYIRRIFAREMGTTISDYIFEIRMKEGKRLIMQENCGVAEAAWRVGYPDSGYFSKSFKKYYKLSPREYLKGSPESGIRKPAD